MATAADARQRFRSTYQHAPSHTYTYPYTSSTNASSVPRKRTRTRYSLDELSLNIISPRKRSRPSKISSPGSAPSAYFARKRGRPSKLESTSLSPSTFPSGRSRLRMDPGSARAMPPSPLLKLFSPKMSEDQKRLARMNSLRDSSRSPSPTPIARMSLDDIEGAIETGGGRRLRRRKNVDYAVSARPWSTPKDKVDFKSLMRETRTAQTKPTYVEISSSDEDELQIVDRSAFETRPKLAVAEKQGDAFFYHHRALFLPLLPEKNYIARLMGGDCSNLKAVEFSKFTEQEVPSGLKATLKPYQVVGLSFLVWLYKNGVSGMLGDEMGLGKTLQTLSFIQWLKEQGPSMSKSGQRESTLCLVVCPLSVLNTWISEARRWTPGLKVTRLHGPIAERKKIKESLNAKSSTGRTSSRSETATCDLVVTSYEIFLAEQSWFKTRSWRQVTLDEGHKIKSEKTQVATALQKLPAKHRLILTGTPLQNNLSELWALLHWLYPNIFTDHTAEKFDSAFNLNKGQVDTSMMDHARKLLELIMLRRMKSNPEVNLNLPHKTEVIIHAPLTEYQRFWYQRLITRSDNGLLSAIFENSKDKDAVFEQQERAERLAVENTAGKDDHETYEMVAQAIKRDEETKDKKYAWQKLMNLLMQLRKCCNHPYTLANALPEPYYVGDHILKASGKFIVLQKLVQRLVVEQRKKILIFSGFTHTLDFIEDLLALSLPAPDKYVRYDGGTSRARRNLNVRFFNDMDSDYRIMLLSTKAGGLGLNLVAATEVVFLDFEWNPQITIQAEARAHRIGQTKPVTVYKLSTAGTVEEQMMGRILKKLYLSLKISQSMRNNHANLEHEAVDLTAQTDDDKMPNLGTNELMSMMRRGASALVSKGVDANEMMNWSFDKILEVCKPADSIEPDAQSTDEQEWLARAELVETKVFEGKRLQKEKEAEDALNYIPGLARADRREGKNTTVMVNGHAVSKESMRCGDWEAVPTMAGKDPRLAEFKKEKREKFENQKHCQLCFDGGELHLCQGCPCSYHLACLPERSRQTAKAKAFQFYCPQHECHECKAKTGEAGGMLLRCRWCPKAYCEDCLDFDASKMVGESLKEFEVLGFQENPQAYFIECPECLADMKANPDVKNMLDEMDAESQAEWTKMFGEDVQNGISKTDSPGEPGTPALTEASTPRTGYSGAKTPYTDDLKMEDGDSTPAGMKRKVGMDTYDTPSGLKKVKAK